MSDPAEVVRQLVAARRREAEEHRAKAEAPWRLLGHDISRAINDLIVAPRGLLEHAQRVHDLAAMLRRWDGGERRPGLADEPVMRAFDLFPIRPDDRDEVALAAVWRLAFEDPAAAAALLEAMDEADCLWRTAAGKFVARLREEWRRLANPPQPVLPTPALPRREVEAAAPEPAPAAPRDAEGVAGADDEEFATWGTVLSAANIADKLGLSPDAVDAALRRFLQKNPDCRFRTDAPRSREPRWLYRVADILPVLRRLKADRPRRDD